MDCEPAPLPQILLYRVYPPLVQEAYWALDDQAASTSGSGVLVCFVQLAKQKAAQASAIVSFLMMIIFMVLKLKRRVQLPVTGVNGECTPLLPQ
jgi:hypothetical protein